MKQKLSAAERIKLINFLKENAKKNSTLHDFQTLIAQFGMELPTYRVYEIMASLRRIAPELFEGTQRIYMKREEIHRIAELVRPHIKSKNPSRIEVFNAVIALGHTITIHNADIVKKALKESAPELFSDLLTAAEIREMATFLRPHITTLNPPYDLLQEIAAKFGKDMSYQSCQRVRADLRRIEPELFTTERRHSPKGGKRRMVRFNLMEADYKIFSEFVGMMGLSNVESLAVLSRAIVYLTVMGDINLLEVLSAAKKMTNAEAESYAEVFSTLNLSNI